ncbi:MAG: class I SAM-dependent methyltransferase [Terriglobales bacterium]
MLLKRLLPRFSTRLLVRRLLWLPIDIWEGLSGRRSRLTPPRGLRFDGGGDFTVTSESTFRELQSWVELRPDSSILEIGCGVGRFAVPLTRVLGSHGRYEGFDIVEAGIHWCRRAISPRFPNFRFTHSDIFNKHYNPDGKALPEHWRFPYADASFDLVVAVSVFTHMTPEAVEHYLAETARVLRPEGKLIASFFILDEESRAMIRQDLAMVALVHPFGTAAVLDPDFPETAIGHDLTSLAACCERVGLSMEVVHGEWRHSKHFRSTHDYLLATHKRPAVYATA